MLIVIEAIKCLICNLCLPNLTLGTHLKDRCHYLHFTREDNEADEVTTTQGTGWKGEAGP